MYHVKFMFTVFCSLERRKKNAKKTESNHYWVCTTVYKAIRNEIAHEPYNYFIYLVIMSHVCKSFNLFMHKIIPFRKCIANVFVSVFEWNELYQMILFSLFRKSFNTDTNKINYFLGLRLYRIFLACTRFYDGRVIIVNL